MSKIIRNLLLTLLIITLTAGFTPGPQAAGISIATATPGGVWNPLGAALAALVSAHVPGLKATARETGGATENVRLLTSGKADLAFTYDYHVPWLNNGKMPGISGKHPARIILGLYEQPLHLVTRQDSGITGLQDLKGKRVSTGAAGSGVEEQAGYVLQALGINPDKDLSRQKLNLNDSAAALQQGKLDAFFWSGAVPSEADITKAMAGLAADPSVKMTFLPIAGGVAQKIIQANPGIFHPSKIAKGEYPGQSADVETLAVTAVLTAMDSFPSTTLASILQAVLDNKSELVPAWKGAASLTPEKSIAVLAPEARPYLHPQTAAVLSERETLYQVSTYNSLAGGHYAGFKTVAQLKQHGDLGSGTFDGLDGEMVFINGQAYQVKDTGKVNLMPDSALVPFAFVTHFEADIVQDLGAVSSVDDLKKALEKLLPHKDAFYAVRLSGTFNKIQVRSVPKQTQPYPELKEAIKNQVIFDYQNIKGTLVGLWSPDYVGGVNVPGPHLHFISEDLTLGGHLLDLNLASGQLSLDETRSLDLVLNPAGE